MSQSKSDLTIDSKVQFGDIFLVVAPGLTELAEKELRLKWDSVISLASEAFKIPKPELILESSSAGISVKGLHPCLGFFLNQCLKIPTRILFRISEFRCRDFPKLFKKVKKTDWKKIFPEEFHLSVQVSAHKSRLMHHKRIESSVSKGIESYCKEHRLNHLSRQNEMMVFVRFDHDTCTLSVDTSGEFLYKRSPDKKTGEAPLRETLAAALYFQMWLLKSDDSLGSVEMIDPMTGSGTFLSEVATFWTTHNRDRFRFLTFAGQGKFKETYRQLASQDLIDCSHIALRGFDQSEESVLRSRENFINAGLNISVEKRDLFDDETVQQEALKNWVFVNPPYGIRIKGDGAFPAYFSKILTQIQNKWNPEMTGMIIPSARIKKGFKIPAGFKLIKKLEFLNGGLRVCFLVVQKG